VPKAYRDGLLRSCRCGSISFGATVSRQTWHCGQSIAAKITQVPAKNAELNWSKRIPSFDSIISREELKYEIRDFLGDQAICHDLPHNVWLLQF
jgi:hypothetical protein